MGTSSVHQNPKSTIPTQRITNLGHDQQQQTLKGLPTLVMINNNKHLKDHQFLSCDLLKEISSTAPILSKM
jgi:hypothetical protein